MATSAKTKVVVGLGLLDIARQVATAYSAQRQAAQERLGFGKGLREDVVTLARDTREKLPSHWEWRHLPPWRHEPTTGERLAKWLPVAAIVGVSTAAVVLAAEYVVHHDIGVDDDGLATDSRLLGTVRAGSQAIDAGVTKVVEGSSGVAVGGAAAVAAGSTAVKAATIERAKVEIDDRVVAPAKQKAIKIGAAAFLGLTAYVIVLSAGVQVLVNAIS